MFDNNNDLYLMVLHICKRLHFFFHSSVPLTAPPYDLAPLNCCGVPAWLGSGLNSTCFATCRYFTPKCSRHLTFRCEKKRWNKTKYSVIVGRSDLILILGWDVSNIFLNIYFLPTPSSEFYMTAALLCASRRLGPLGLLLASLRSRVDSVGQRLPVHTFVLPL